MKHPYRKMVDDTLLKFGGLYTFEDLIEAISEGEMQSFHYGDSWAVTRICNFPRRRVLSVEFMVGDWKELMAVYHEIEEFAEHHGIDYLMANGRPGFETRLPDGWKRVSATYVKDLKDGQ